MESHSPGSPLHNVRRSSCNQPLLSHIAFVLSIPVLLPFVSASGLRAQTPGIDIDYTGSLLGYYRMEADEDPSKNLPPVSEFLVYRSGPDKSGRLLLGMGDNFGPEFGASLQLENASGSQCYQTPTALQDKQTKPESLYKNDDRIANAAQCDNVLNFMMHAGFGAVVPGYQDFMYTARWLRGAARLLAEESDPDSGSTLIKSNDHHLNLLAANLRIALNGKVNQADKGGSNRPFYCEWTLPAIVQQESICGEYGPLRWRCPAG